MKKLFVSLIVLSAIQASAQQDTGNTKKEVLKILPNPSQSGSFELRSNDNEQLSFYVFDLSGTLVYQTVLKEKGKHTIQNLTKGTYVYDVFKNDEGIKHGSLVVK